MTSKTELNKNSLHERQVINKKILRKVFLHSIPMEHSWNYERMMNLGYCYAMILALKAIYGDDK